MEVFLGTPWLKIGIQVAEKHSKCASPEQRVISSRVARFMAGLVSKNGCFQPVPRAGQSS